MRVHLVGHSFGARLVSFALAGLPAGLEPSPVKAVTLLQGAFSQCAFAPRLPFDADRRRRAGRACCDRIDGPLAVCFSEPRRRGRDLLPARLDGRPRRLGRHRRRRVPVGRHRRGRRAGRRARRTEGIRGAGPGVTYPFAGPPGPQRRRQRRSSAPAGRRAARTATSSTRSSPGSSCSRRGSPADPGRAASRRRGAWSKMEA